jgi:hypothetical protein
MGKKMRSRSETMKFASKRDIAPKWLLLIATLTSQFMSSVGNSIYVVGYNDYGQLGLGDYLQRSTQTKMIGETLQIALCGIERVAHGSEAREIFCYAIMGDLHVLIK